MIVGFLLEELSLYTPIHHNYNNLLHIELVQYALEKYKKFLLTWFEFPSIFYLAKEDEINK